MSPLPFICVVTLSLFCVLPAKPVTPPSLDITEMLLIIKYLEPSRCADDKATFYSPDNVQENCLFSALDCYKNELDVVDEECKIDSEEMLNLKTTLYNFNLTDPSCSNFTCESFPQRPFKGFLENMKNLIQQIMSQRSGRQL